MTGPIIDSLELRTVTLTVTLGDLLNFEAAGVNWFT